MASRCSFFIIDLEFFENAGDERVGLRTVVGPRERTRAERRYGTPSMVYLAETVD